MAARHAPAGAGGLLLDDESWPQLGRWHNPWCGVQGCCTWPWCCIHHAMEILRVHSGPLGSLVPVSSCTGQPQLHACMPFNACPCNAGIASRDAHSSCNVWQAGLGDWAHVLLVQHAWRGSLHACSAAALRCGAAGRRAPPRNHHITGCTGSCGCGAGVELGGCAGMRLVEVLAWHLRCPVSVHILKA